MRIACFVGSTTSFLVFGAPYVTHVSDEIKMCTSMSTCNAIVALPEMAPLIQVIPFLGTPIYHVVVISCPHCLLCSGADVLASMPSGSGWPYRGQSPIFPDVAVGWGNFVTAAPAAPPSQMSKRSSSSIPAGRTNRGRRQNTATKTKATKGERTDDTRLGWDRPRPRSDGRRSRKDGRLDPHGRSRRRLESLWRKKVPLPSSLHLLFLLFFIFLTFSRPCQPPLFSFGVHHSKTYVSAKFLWMFDMKMWNIPLGNRDARSNT